MGFLDAINQLKKQTEVCDLNILVWGPGKNNGEHHEKRLKLKQEIFKCFRNAEVLFSEDLNLADALPGSESWTFQAQQLWHLAACDVCVILDTSSGAGEEVAHFVGSPYAYKLLILTHESLQHSGGFPASLRRCQNQIFYNDEQYVTCNLVEHVIARIKTVALGRLLGMRV
jgi:hypothetical protein